MYREFSRNFPPDALGAAPVRSPDTGGCPELLGLRRTHGNAFAQRVIPRETRNGPESAVPGTLVLKFSRASAYSSRSVSDPYAGKRAGEALNAPQSAVAFALAPAFPGFGTISGLTLTRRRNTQIRWSWRDAPKPFFRSGEYGSAFAPWVGTDRPRVGVCSPAKKSKAERTWSSGPGCRGAIAREKSWRIPASFQNTVLLCVWIGVIQR